MNSNRLAWGVCVLVSVLLMSGCVTSYSNLKVNGKSILTYVDSHDTFIIKNNIEGTELKNIRGGGWTYEFGDLAGVGTGNLVKMPIDPWYDVPRVELVADVCGLDGKLLGVARAPFSFWKEKNEQSRYGDPPQMWLVSYFERVMTIEEAGKVAKSQ